MIRYSIVAITVFLNIIQYFDQHNNIKSSLSPFILELNIITGSMMILTLLISKIITQLFYKINPECKQYDDGKPIAGANVMADFLSFVICAALTTLLFKMI